jgi:hypothetical protein
MTTLIVNFKDDNNSGVMWCNNEIRETPKMLIFPDRRYKKSEFNFFLLTDENLSERGKNRAIFILDSVFCYNGVALDNGDILSLDKKDNEFLINHEEIISKGDFEDILRSEIGLSCF